MKIILVISAVLLAYFASEVRVKPYKERYIEALKMNRLAILLEKNYKEKMESPLNVCSEFFDTNIKDFEAFDNTVSSEFTDTDYVKTLSSLPFITGSDVMCTVDKLKNISTKAHETSKTDLDNIRSSVYVFYPGITLIFALLII